MRSRLCTALEHAVAGSDDEDEDCETKGRRGSHEGIAAMLDLQSCV